MFAYDRQTATTRRTQFIPAKVGIGMTGSTVLFFGNAGEEIGQNPYGWYVGNIESGAYAFLGSYTELGIEDVYDLVSDTLAVVRCYREDGIGYDVGTYDLTTGELQVISGGVHNTSWTSCDAGRVVWTGQESEADLWDIYLTTLREW